MEWLKKVGLMYGIMLDMKYINLTNGGTTKVDDEDYEYLNQWKWQNSGGYARRSEYVSNLKLPSGKHRSINKGYSMHRVVNKTPEGYDTDHINHDKLDNRKLNLRTVTRSNNRINLAKKAKGVQYRKDRKKSPYRVYVSHDKKEIYVACFRYEDDAEQAYYTVNEQLNKGVLQW